MTILEAITTPTITNRRIIGATIEALRRTGDDVPANNLTALRDFAVSLPAPANEVALDELARRLEAWERAQ